MTAEKYISYGRLTALFSFIVGTGIFGLYYLSSSFDLLFLGFGFIILVGLINIIILISILIKANKDNDNQKRLFRTAGLMLLNIPVMLVYCWLTMVLMNTMRITFVNKTSTLITDINISGCDPKHFDKLEIGESKTIWISIKGDCGITIDYKVNGQKKEEDVAGYVTNDNGSKMEYDIGITKSEDL